MKQQSQEATNVSKFILNIFAGPITPIPATRPFKAVLTQGRIQPVMLGGGGRFQYYLVVKSHNGFAL